MAAARMGALAEALPKAGTAVSEMIFPRRSRGKAERPPRESARPRRPEAKPRNSRERKNRE